MLALALFGCGGAGSKSDPPAAPTAQIQAAATQVTPGQSIALTWTTTNASSVTIQPSISTTALPLSGSATVTPQASTNYQLTASGPGGTAASSVMVNVTAPPPPTPVVTLVSSPSAVSSGVPSTLTWTSTNAASVSIQPAVGTAALPLSGSVSVTPGATTSYTITATGAQMTATATATVTVLAPGAAQSPIQHLIVVILQNHSFDNLFGTFPGAHGLDPTLPSYTQTDAAGNVITPTLLSSLNTADVKHDSASYAAAYDGGKMDKYALTNGDLSMQYFDSTSSGTAVDGKTYSVAELWSLAQQYSLADNFFASAMNSEPANVLYMMAATIHNARTAGSYPYYDKCTAAAEAAHGGTTSVPLTETNVGDQLNAAKVSWTWYHQNFSTSVDGTCVDYVPQENPMQYFTTTQYSANLKNFTLGDFATALSTSSSFPSVAWITPAPLESMHPGSGDAANGIAWLKTVVNDVKSSALWPSTAILVMWDESGGWYDDVPPPQLANSMGLGARVPVLLISPYAKAGAISHQQMDFVSILRFVQWNWGLGMFTAAAQAAREQQSGDICDLLTIPCGSP
jgi:phospholipase C